MCGDWSFREGVIVDGSPEGVAMVAYLGYIGYMWSIGTWCEVPRGK